MKRFFVLLSNITALAIGTALFFGCVTNISQVVREPATAGGMDGGGGSFVNIDGKVTISDLYYKSISRVTSTPIKPVAYKELPPAVRSEIERIIDWKLKISAKNFVDQLAYEIKSDRRNYLLVPKGLEEKAVCNDYLADLTTKVNAHYRFGCTNGETTFLFVDKLQTADATQQAYGIIHERLWAAFAGITQEQVTSIIRVTQLSEQIAKEQQNGKHLMLSQSEILEMDQLFNLEVHLASNDGSFEFVGNTLMMSGIKRAPGGGLVLSWEKNNVPVIENSIIGVGSIVGIGTKIVNSLILVSSVSADQIVNCKVSNSKISLNAFSSEFYSSDIGRSSSLSYKDKKNKGYVSNLKVIDSNVTFLFDTISEGNPTSPNTINKSNIVIAVVGKSFHLKNVNINSAFNVIFGENVNLQNFKFSNHDSSIDFELIKINGNTYINGFSKQFGFKPGVLDKRFSGLRLRNLSDGEWEQLRSDNGRIDIGLIGSVKHPNEIVTDLSGHRVEIHHSDETELIDDLSGS